MTTIAWDGHTLAADTRMCSGSLPIKVSKICRLDDGRLMGCCGHMAFFEAMKRWLNNPSAEKPHKDDNSRCMIIDKEKVWLIEDSLTPYELTYCKFHAIGSGRDFAMAAMYLGFTAEKAVEVACKFDVYSGLPVQTLDFSTLPF